MSKYIDAEKLIAEIERIVEEETPISKGSDYYHGVADTADKLLSFITSLQQEQPKFKVGDTIHKKGENTVFPMVIERISDGDYVCDNAHSFINIKYQDDYELVQQEQQETEMKSPFTGGKVAILLREEEVTFRGERINVTRKYYRCEDTGREFTDSKLDDDMMWAVFRAYCEKKGITSFTDIMLKQEQPEVEFEKELKNERTKLLDAFGPMNGEQSLAIRNFARHFYELGLNARKEE